MTKEESLADVQYAAAIVPNGVTKIDSIFDFDDVGRVFQFLHACRAEKSTVEFLNEEIVYEWTEDDPFSNLKITLYISLKANPKMVDDFIRWLLTKERRKED